MSRKKINIVLIINSICMTIMLFGITLCLIPFISITTKKAVPKIFNNAIVKIESDSMMPEFKNDQIIIVNEIRPVDINIGDRIAYYVFYENGSVKKIEFHEVANIVVDPKGNYFFDTKGTASLELNANPVHQDAVVGKYSKKSQFLISILTFSTSTIGIFLFVIIPFILLVALQLLIFRYVNKKGEKKYA